MVKFIQNIVEQIVTSYWGGFLSILLGVLLIYYTIKNPQKDKYSPLQGDIRGGAGGICLILVGIGVIVFKFLGKL